MTMIGIDKTIINTENVQAAELLPTLFGPEMGTYTSKTGGIIEYHYVPEKSIVPSNCYVERTSGNLRVGLEDRARTAEGGEKMQLNCQLQELSMKKHGIIGYAVKLELLQRTETAKIRKTVVAPLFQFRYDEYFSKYVREAAERVGGQQYASCILTKIVHQLKALWTILGVREAKVRMLTVRETKPITTGTINVFKVAVPRKEQP